MRHAKAWRATLAVAAVSALGMAVPAQASAFTSWYSCVSKPSGQWCDGRANGTYDGQHSWDYNSGAPTSGSFYVCQQVYHPASGTSLAGSSCGLDFVSHVYGNVTCVCYDAEVAQTSGSPQSINGFADADF
ncbi:MAG TPA: hypothetical protein VHF88_03340 [Thermoleophilaceae bacterium]|nr:hypothetical protein [Thermoleophilaceae bacterium]